MTDGLYTDHLMRWLEAHPPVPRYTGAQASRITGASYRQVDYWISSGVVTLDEDDSHPGSGFQRGLTVDDLVRLRIVKALTDAMTLQAAARVLANVDINADTVEVHQGAFLTVQLNVAACRADVDRACAGVQPILRYRTLEAGAA